MSNKHRQRMVIEAARLVNLGRDMATARFRAARKVNRGWVPAEELPSDCEIRQALSTGRPAVDRFDRIAESVGLLASVRRHPDIGAASDGLEHTLTAFSAVFAEQPYDEELLTAALVGHAGLAIDRTNPQQAVLKALDGCLTTRTAWLVESMPLAASYTAGTIGHRARHRLEAHQDFEQVMLLSEASRRAASADARNQGLVSTPLSLEEAIEILRSLDAEDPETGACD